jgi:hypothetical protein
MVVSCVFPRQDHFNLPTAGAGGIEKTGHARTTPILG